MIPQIWPKILIAKTSEQPITLSHKSTSGLGLKSGSRYDRDQVSFQDFSVKRKLHRILALFLV